MHRITAPKCFFAWTDADDFQARQYLTSLQNNYKGTDDIAGMIENRLSKLKK